MVSLNMNAPLASIIIPVRNEEKYLEECLDSILKQTVTQWECILIDDGSTDATIQIIKRYQLTDNRFKLHTQVALGLIEALNNGISNAIGKYIVRIDGDDIMPSTRLNEQISYLEKCTKPTLVTGQVEYFSNEKISSGYVNYQNWLNSMSSHQDFIDNALKECPVAAPGWAAPLSLVKAINGFETGIYPEDYHFILRAILYGVKFKMLNTPVLKWRHYQQRTSLISDDYSPKNFWTLKAKHLKSYLNKFKPNKEYWLLGSGDSAKNLLKNLCKPEQIFKAIMVKHPDKDNKEYMNIPMIHWNTILDKKLYLNNMFLIIAAGRHNNQVKLKTFLKEQLNFTEGKDYIFIC